MPAVSNVKSTAIAGDVSSASLFSLILTGLDDKKLFQSVSLASCLPVKSYDRLRRSKPIKALLELFSSAGLPCEVGFNFGSECISFFFELKDALPAKPVASPSAAIVWCMLGLLPDDVHGELETRWTEQLEVFKAESEEKTASIFQNKSLQLANQCLDHFLMCTGVAISDRGLDLKRNQLKVVVDSAVRRMRNTKDGHLYMDNSERPHHFSPIFYQLSGRSPEPIHEESVGVQYSEEVLRVQQTSVVQRIIDDFWKVVAKELYFPDPGLQRILSEQLENYFVAATKTQSATFRPTHPLGLYLHGTAGTGKSRFVQVLLHSLREVVHKYIEPEKRVDVVRVPLNATTPGTLMRILLVRGISDWSVERIMEQTISRGGLVVLHLEENPADADLQQQFFELVQKMVKKLESRYPEYRNHVVFAFTANYPAIESLHTHAAPVLIHPPDGNTQRIWCERTLEQTLNEKRDDALTIRVKLSTSPPHDNDMRKLERWRRCLAFLVTMHLEENADSVDTRQDLSIEIGGEERCLSVSFPGSSISQLSLKSLDSYFFFSADGRLAHSDLLTESGVASELHPRILSVVHMLKHDFIKPAVFVLTGPKPARDAVQNAILRLSRNVFGEGNYSELCFEARVEDDKASIFGDPDPSNGPLQRFIDGINNPIYEKDKHFALINAHVNEWGQFMLREVLEPSDSQTHVTVIRKERLLFVVSIDDDSSVSAQMESRAHDIIACK